MLLSSAHRHTRAVFALRAERAACSKQSQLICTCYNVWFCVISESPYLHVPQLPSVGAQSTQHVLLLRDTLYQNFLSHKSIDQLHQLLQRKHKKLYNTRSSVTEALGISQMLWEAMSPTVNEFDPTGELLPVDFAADRFDHSFMATTSR